MQLACAPPPGFLPARKTSSARHWASRRAKVTERADCLDRLASFCARLGLLVFKVLRVRVFIP